MTFKGMNTFQKLVILCLHFKPIDIRLWCFDALLDQWPAYKDLKTYANKQSPGFSPWFQGEDGTGGGKCENYQRKKKIYYETEH